MLPDFHPFLPFLLAGVLALFTRGWPRSVIMLAAPLIGGLHLLGVEPGAAVHWRLMDLDLTVYRVDELSLLFGYLFHLGAFLCVLFALHLKDPLQHAAGMIYAGSAVGAVFAGDLLTLFVFWELLGLSSTFLVWASRDERSLRARMRYLVSQVLSGVLLLGGALGRWRAGGSLAFGEIGLCSGACWLLFQAFGIEWDCPLMQNWAP